MIEIKWEFILPQIIIDPGPALLFGIVTVEHSFVVADYITGLMSVVGQNLENIIQALTVLDTTVDNQYGIRSQPRFDKVALIRHLNLLDLF